MPTSQTLRHGKHLYYSAAHMLAGVHRVLAYFAADLAASSSDDMVTSGWCLLLDTCGLSVLLEKSKWLCAIHRPAPTRRARSIQLQIKVSSKV